MTKAASLLPLLLFPLFSWCQKKIPWQDPVTIADLRMNTCPFEADAPAMVLFDIQETETDGDIFGGYNKTTRKVRIKVFSDKGYEHATVRIPYLNRKAMGRIKKLEGTVYKLDAAGTIVKEEMGKKDFLKEKANEFVGVINFTFPNLKPGCIVEYSYTTVENAFQFFRPWFLQDQIPVAFASRTFITPVTTHLNVRTYGFDSLQQQYFLFKQDRNRNITYYKENIPSYRIEPYMSSLNDYLMRASFTSLAGGAVVNYASKKSIEQGWSSLGSGYLRSNVVKKMIFDSLPATTPIISAAKKLTGTEDRIRFVFDTVRNHFRSKAEQSMEADSLEAVWKSREATSAEVNFILLNMLVRSGVQCAPVLVSTRNNGKVKKDFPGLSQMDGMDVLAFDSTKSFLLDASIRMQSYNTPPMNVLNREALLLSSDTAQWITITDERPLLKQSIDVYADVTKDGKLEGSATVQYYDYAKSNKLDTTHAIEESDKKLMDTRPSGFKVTSTQKEDFGGPMDPLTETIEFTYEPQNSGQFYFIDPQMLTAKNKNPFLAEGRTTDVDMGCNQLYVLTMQIHFPPAFEADHLPQNLMIRAPDSSFFYKVSYTADKEAIYISQMFETKRAVFSKDEYPGIQDFFKKMYARMGEEIVLKKKE